MFDQIFIKNILFMTCLYKVSSEAPYRVSFIIIIIHMERYIHIFIYKKDERSLTNYSRKKYGFGLILNFC